MRQIEAVEVLRIIWRRLWLIIIIVGVTLGLLMFRARVADPVYEADVTLMITTPDREDVAVTDEYTFTSDRDLIVTAVNSFVEIAQYEEAKNRTKAVLGITEDYDVTVDAEIGADLIYVSVAADEPELAQQLANTHAQQAIQYFGELRARPSTQGIGYFETELAAASQELTDAESAMAAFLMENNIAVSLEDEIALQQAVLEELEIAQVQDETSGPESSDELSVVAEGERPLAERIQEQRDRLNELILLRPQYNLLRGNIQNATVNQERTNARSAMSTFLMENNIAVSLEDEIALQQAVLEELEIAQVQDQTSIPESSDELSLVAAGSRTKAELIQAKRERLNELTLLRPQYNLLKGDVEQAQRRYDTLSARMTDTKLRGSFAGEALFVQVIKEAEQPDEPRNQTIQTLVLGFIASLGLGILAAFVLDYALVRW